MISYYIIICYVMLCYMQIEVAERHQTGPEDSKSCQAAQGSGVSRGLREHQGSFRGGVRCSLDSCLLNPGYLPP